MRLASAWLLEWIGNPWEMKHVKCCIAGVLSGRFKSDRLTDVMPAIYLNHIGTRASEVPSIGAMIRTAKGEDVYPVRRSPHGELVCGASPLWLVGRKVRKVALSERHGFDVLEWEQDVCPALDPKKGPIEQLENLVPPAGGWPKTRRHFDAKTNRIVTI
jgi:hypothetical protein